MRQHTTSSAAGMLNNKAMLLLSQTIVLSSYRTETEINSILIPRVAADTSPWQRNLLVNFKLEYPKSALKMHTTTTTINFNTTIVRAN